MWQWWSNLVSRGEAEVAPDFEGVPWLVFAVILLALAALAYGLFQFEAAARVRV